MAEQRGNNKQNNKYLLGVSGAAAKVPEPFEYFQVFIHLGGEPSNMRSVSAFSVLGLCPSEAIADLLLLWINPLDLPGFPKACA